MLPIDLNVDTFYFNIASTYACCLCEKQRQPVLCVGPSFLTLVSFLLLFVIREVRLILHFTQNEALLTVPLTYISEQFYVSKESKVRV